MAFNFRIFPEYEEDQEIETSNTNLSKMRQSEINTTEKIDVEP